MNILHFACRPKNDKLTESCFHLCKWNEASLFACTCLAVGGMIHVHMHLLDDLRMCDMLMSCYMLKLWVLWKYCMWTIYSVFAMLWQHEGIAIAGIVQECYSLFSWGSATLHMKNSVLLITLHFPEVMLFWQLPVVAALKRAVWNSYLSLPQNKFCLLFLQRVMTGQIVSSIPIWYRLPSNALQAICTRLVTLTVEVLLPSETSEQNMWQSREVQKITRVR